jgi:hypothetical protein
VGLSTATGQCDAVIVQLLIAAVFLDVRQTERRTPELLGPEPRSFGDEITIKILKTYKSLITDQIAAEFAGRYPQTCRLCLEQQTKGRAVEGICAYTCLKDRL